MKKSLRFNLLFSLLLVLTMLFTGVVMLNTNKVSAATKGKGTIDVYLIGGQSNSVGYGLDTNGALAAEDSRFKNGFDNVLYYGEQERWGTSPQFSDFETVKLGQGVSNYSYNTTSGVFNDVRSGAEIGIAKALADNGKMNAIIKCAWGATHIYPDTLYNISLEQGTWTSPTYIKNYNVDLSANEMIGRMYNWFTQTVTTGIAKLVEKGYTPVIKGMWWMQGEAEMFTQEMSSAYGNLLKTLISDVRADVSAITGQDCSEMPFVFGLPSWNENRSAKPPFQDAVRNQMKSVANDFSVVNAGYVDTLQGPNGTGLVQHDDWHFDAASQRWIGEQFIAQVNALTEGDNDSFNETISMYTEPTIRVEEPNGIRFGAKIANYNESNNYSYGMFILPTDYLTNNNITGKYLEKLAEKNLEVINLSCNVLDGDFDGNGINENYIQGSIVNIKYNNVNRAFTGIAYIKDAQGKYLYTSSSVSVTPSIWASKEIINYSATDAEYAILNNFVNAGINKANGAQESQGYEEVDIDLSIPSNITVYMGTTGEQLVATQTPALNYYVEYVSNNESIAKVDANGLITPVSTGTTTITVTCAKTVKTVQVNVEYYSANGLVLDGSISAQEESIFGANQISFNETRKGTVKALVYNNDIYFAITIEHGEWSPLSNVWYQNDNFEIYINSEQVIIKYLVGELVLPKQVYCGVSKTTRNGSDQVTVLEFCIKGNKDAYKLNLNANGAGFGWNGICWYELEKDANNKSIFYEYATISSNGIFLPGNALQASIEGITLDGQLTDSIYNTITPITTTANSTANLTIKGAKTEKGVIMGVTIVHTKDPNLSVTNESKKFYTYTNMEFRINNGKALFVTTQNICSDSMRGKMYGVCKSVNNGNGTYTSTYEIFAYYDDLGVKSTDTLNVAFGGWFESGWAWLFGGNEYTSTHTITSTGIVKK